MLPTAVAVVGSIYIAKDYCHHEHRVRNYFIPLHRNSKRSKIMAGTVHPQRGYLNTRFSIHNNGDSTLSFSIMNKSEIVLSANIPANNKKDFFVN